MRAQFEAIGMHDPDYIGDGVYIGHDQYGETLKIALCDGMRITNMIVMEKSVFVSLCHYRDRMVEDGKLGW